MVFHSCSIRNQFSVIDEGNTVPYDPTPSSITITINWLSDIIDYFSNVLKPLRYPERNFISSMFAERRLFQSMPSVFCVTMKKQRRYQCVPPCCPTPQELFLLPGRCFHGSLAESYLQISSIFHFLLHKSDAIKIFNHPLHFFIFLITQQ